MSEDVSAAAAPPPELTRLVFSAAPQAYLILDPDLNIIDVNERYLELTGTRREHLVGRHVFDAFPDNPNDVEADGTRNVGRSFQTVLETGRAHALSVLKYDIPVRDGPDGAFEERYWRPVNTPVLKDGRVVAIIHQVEDVTEETLDRREQSMRLRLATYISGLGFWEYDPSGGTVNVSRAFAEMFGFEDTQGTVPEEYVFRCIHPEDLPAVRDALTGDPDQTRVEFENRVLLPGGKTRWVISHGERLRDHTRALPRLVGVTLDITAAKRREEELARALEERDLLLEQKDVLLGDVNHRIKNSLQLVSSILHMEAREAEGRESARLKSAAARVGAVTSVHQLLYRTGQVSTVAMGEYLRDLTRSLAESGERDGRSLALDLNVPDLVLSTDIAIPVALLVNELTTNAFGHAFVGRDDGKVQVRANLEGPDFVLTVADNGIGRNHGSDGTGLGTRIVSALVSQLGAEMEERNAAPGHEVRIRIPLDPS